MSAPDLNQIRSWLETAPDNVENIGYALVAVAERLDTANKLAAAAVYVSLGDLIQARSIVQKVHPSVLP
jgi:hypothetical protein